MGNPYQQQIMMATPLEEWVSVFGPTYWDVAFGTWDGTKYLTASPSFPNIIYLDAVGTWGLAFRDNLSAMRVTIQNVTDGGPEQTSLLANSGVLAADFIGSHQSTQVVPFNTYSLAYPDITQFTQSSQFDAPQGNWEITDIEFLATAGWSPA